ncbi:MAG: transcriptional regulator, LacI family [Clostridia bacterium]|jgi:LacI family transcriptional regulator|nr:transcriptional regulator, LacI family [Clostridia bacterium]
MKIKDIAEKAGVSQSTVSLALNNKGGVKEETRRVILELASQYGYSKKSNAIKKNILLIKYINSGVSIDKNGDFIARVIDAIEETASKYGYSVVIKNIMASQMEKEIDNMGFEEFVGMAFLATEASDDVIEILSKVPIPIVTVDNMFENCNIDSVVMDNYYGIFTAVNYLYSQGHRKIGYIDSTINFSNMIQRERGYRRALKALNLDYNERYIVEVVPTLEGAYQSMEEYLQNTVELPTVYIAANDTMAIGAVKALKQYKIEVPEQVSIMGFDDIPFCVILDSPLTTMRVEKERLGQMAIKLLDEKINNPCDTYTKILVQPKLMIRESVYNLNKNDEKTL